MVATRSNVFYSVIGKKKIHIEQLRIEDVDYRVDKNKKILDDSFNQYFCGIAQNFVKFLKTEK